MQSILDKITRQVQDEMQPISGGLYSIVKSAAEKVKQFREQQLVPPEGQPVVQPEASPEARASLERAFQGASGIARSILSFPGQPLEEALTKGGAPAPLAFAAGLAGDIATPGPGGEIKRIMSLKKYTKVIPFLNKWFKSAPGSLDVPMYEVRPLAASAPASIATATERMSMAAAGGMEKRAPVFISDEGVILDGKATYHALKEKGVTSIRVTTDHPAKRTIQERMDRAPEVLPRLKEMIENTARSFGATPLVGPVKQMERALIKTFGENDGNVDALRDIFRGSIVAPVEKMRSVMDDIARQFEIVGPISDKVTNPVYGFRGYKANVRVPLANGASEVVEIQVVSPKVNEFAKVRGHAILDQLRNGRGSKKISPFERKQQETLQRESTEGYEKAWLEDKGERLNAAKPTGLVYDEDLEQYVTPGSVQPTQNQLPSAFPSQRHDPFFGPPAAS